MVGPSVLHTTNTKHTAQVYHVGTATLSAVEQHEFVANKAPISRTSGERHEAHVRHHAPFAATRKQRAHDGGLHGARHVREAQHVKRAKARAQHAAVAQRAQRVGETRGRARSARGRAASHAHSHVARVQLREQRVEQRRGASSQRAVERAQVRLQHARGLLRDRLRRGVARHQLRATQL